jgi:hypothetical protein
LKPEVVSRLKQRITDAKNSVGKCQYIIEKVKHKAADDA